MASAAKNRLLSVLRELAFFVWLMELLQIRQGNLRFSQTNEFQAYRRPLLLAFSFSDPRILRICLLFLLYPIQKGQRYHLGCPNCGRAVRLCSLLSLVLIHVHQKRVSIWNSLRLGAL